MDQNSENNQNINQKIIFFFDKNKKKIFLILIFFVISIGFVFFFENNKNKQNNIISEKYTNAGLYLAAGKKNESKKIYDEIILSKNKIYSILSLNIILEKELEADSNKVLKYFEILENIDHDDENYQELIVFKKALYLIKNSKNEEGLNLIKKLSDKNSRFKILAEDILRN